MSANRLTDDISEDTDIKRFNETPSFHDFVQRLILNWCPQNLYQIQRFLLFRRMRCALDMCTLSRLNLPGFDIITDDFDKVTSAGELRKNATTEFLQFEGQVYLKGFAEGYT